MDTSLRRKEFVVLLIPTPAKKRGCGKLRSDSPRACDGWIFSDPDMGTWKSCRGCSAGPTRALDGNDSALVQRAALALLSGEGEATTDKLLGQFGLAELSFRQGDGATGETVVSIGRQLSQRWYVGYERGVNATTGSWQLVYRIAQRFTVRAQSGEENAIDFIWSWRW